MAGLTAEVRVRRDGFTLSAQVEAEQGEVIAVFGPNGAGKSTLLDCVAGLRRPQYGTVRLGGRTLTDCHAGVHVPPHARGVGLLGQQPLLFPHLSVLGNVEFGPRACGAGKRAARRVADEWLERLDLATLADRKPARLSGGQAQRVALARALARSPELLLLDEPLAALDAETAPAMRSLLREVLRHDGSRTCALLVTHDPLDALALADRIIVLERGAVVERGRTGEALAAPRTGFTARIAGLNLVTGHAVDGGLRTLPGTMLAGMHAPDAVRAQPAVAVFAPSAVVVYRGACRADGRVPEVVGSQRNLANALVGAVEPHGSVVRVRLAAHPDHPEHAWVAGIAADLTPTAVAELGLEPGRAVGVAVKATAVEVHPAVTAAG
ncbi:ATP-binding cassette domain-containing protein [Haloechinothrix sp. LS1_15]|uniref:sulfate/molybdate ABC transporter ATP-binding protein n=1 Tax=Haloechinothrix sp. LS1_15 TaxID=2652248 RepID=UPI0029449A5C|nr:ATP-binding cassette domain-containing protein [Haloechinothrix sp. LS1_15]MDV6014376.1 ATP-binding cassette domain-containing protein [Haloechinothrix sp. LS1_15]